MAEDIGPTTRADDRPAAMVDVVKAAYEQRYGSRPDMTNAWDRGWLTGFEVSQRVSAMPEVQKIRAEVAREIAEKYRQQGLGLPGHAVQKT